MHFPWLEGDNQSYWAPIATLMSGGGRGSWFMPEEGDEVLVAFEHGDVNYPFIVGFLWNGEDRPPNDDINTSVRRLRTVSGHVLEFDDNGGSERIRVETQGGNKILLEDTPTPKITVETAGHNKIIINNAPPGITVKTASGDVTVELRARHRQCARHVSVDMPIANFSGMVRTPILQATSVVGSAYTPAPGNTYGM